MRELAKERTTVLGQYQKVRINYLEKEFSFDAFEPIHLEFSCKYLEKDIEFLAKETGFEIVEIFKDNKGYFADTLLRVIKD